MKNIPGYATSEVLLDDRGTTVVRARNDRRDVVLRYFSKDYPTPQELARLRYGYEICARLDLPGVVKVLGLERSGNGLVLCMEDFGGWPLGKLLAAGPLDVAEALDIAAQVARTLEELHRRHIVHKNVQPASIFVSRKTGEAKLSHFDIASRLGRESPTLTDLSRMEGFLPYISPEQTGRMNRLVDSRTDLYSLGVTLYEMLTGRVPFHSSDPMTLVHSHLAALPVPPHEVRPSIPKVVSAVVLKLLAKNAEDRYQSAHGLAEDLRECTSQLRSTATLTSFALGRYDVPTALLVPQKLYGRDAERATLIQALERAAAGAPECVLVSGTSGVGKTALVSEVHKPLVRLHGYFTFGKFTQIRSTPYAAFLQAFRGLIRQLLAESERSVEAWRERMLEALGANARVVIDVLPEVELIIGPQPPVPALGPTEAQNRFNLVVQQFVGVFTSEEHPLALFLDDLQWADAASIALMRRLLRDANSQNLLLIGAYRDNEIRVGHPLAAALAELRDGPAAVSEIALQPLAPEAIRVLVAETFRRDPEAPELAELAAIVHQRTDGNPFFINELMALLQDRDLVSYAPEQGAWRWSLPRIRGEAVSESVASLMADRIRRLPADTREALTLAACLGATVDLGTLASVSERPMRAMAADLWAAVREGLLLPVGESYRYLRGEADEGAPISSRSFDGADEAVEYAFVHDRVRESAYGLIEGETRARVHLRIGRLRLQRTPEDRREAVIFDIVDHLNLGRGLIEDQSERDGLAHLCLVAVERARTSNAYDAAVRYATLGAELLGAGAWERDHGLSFALDKRRAECAYLLGRHEEAMLGFERLLERARSNDERSEIYSLKMNLCQAIGRFHDSIAAGRDGLALYGIRTPDPEDLGPACGAEMAALGAALAGRAVRDLKDLPEAEDPEDRRRIHLLAEAILYGSYAVPELFQLLTMTLVRLSLERGNAPGSSIGYAAYAMLLGAALRDYATAYEFGLVALAVSERLDDRDRRAIVNNYFGGFVHPWRKPLREGIPYLDAAYAGCLEAGSLTYAGYAALHRVDQAFMRGEELHEVYERARKHAEFQRRINQLDLMYSIMVCQHACLLFTKGLVPEDLRDQLEERVLLDKLSHYPASLAFYYTVALQIAFFYGDHVRAIELARKAEAAIGMLFGNIKQIELSFYHALTAAALHPAASDADKPGLRAVVEENLEKLRHWADNCPENVAPKRALVAAEAARVAGRDQEATDLYDGAIELADAYELLPIQALANELAARFFLAKGRHRIARPYLMDARHAYARWGADAKVAALDAAHRELMPRETTEARGGASSAALDLLAVMKASQAISGEIILEDLIRTLMVTLLENAGAQRGALILKGESPLIVEVIGGKTPTAVYTRADAADGRASISMSIVRYVERTSERVVLADAARAPEFQADPYVARVGPKSVLCMPIVRQQRLVGTLYLENNLVTDAFTPERCRVLELMSAQAAISIENARLYDTLENRVKERTRELQQSNEELMQALRRLKETQKQLISQEKLASLGALTAGIAHELKNPLNFINNFSDLSTDMVAELAEGLKDRYGELDEELEEILASVQQNATKTREHSRRADHIINGMLLHSRGAAGAREETDLNAMLAETVNLAYHGMRGQEPGFSIELDASYDPGVGLVEMATSELSRVFLNIINNAYHAMGQKRLTTGPGYTPVLRVATATVGAQVEIRIHDNGTGIPAEVLGKIFDPFFTTKPTGLGTGLGLSISHDIVQSHSGELRVHSVPGELTEFVITLPRRAPAPD